MKISVLGAGNVGSLTAMRLAQENLGDIILVDIIKGLAQGKALDLEDAGPIFGHAYSIRGTDTIQEIRDSDIIVITAGLARRPGMSREDLLAKNSQILKEISLNIKEIAPDAIIIVVTNPLDLMTYLSLKITGFNPRKVLGMGISLDASRFANIISQETGIPASEIKAVVIGSHGEGMLPLPRFTILKGNNCYEFLKLPAVEGLVKKTVSRGAEIVSLLGSASAYFAPSIAIAEIVRAIVKDEKRDLGACAYLNGEYALKDICLGVPCVIGREGVEKIIELDLNKEERGALSKSAELIYRNLTLLARYIN